MSEKFNLVEAEINNLPKSRQGIPRNSAEIMMASMKDKDDIIYKDDDTLNHVESILNSKKELT